MAGKSVYLAGPLDYTDLGEHKFWRKDALAFLHDFCIFDPASAFCGSPLEDPGALRAINLTAVRGCTGMLAAVFPDEPSWGTPIEIVTAERLSKSVVLWSPQGKIPGYLAHLPRESDLEMACTVLDGMLDSLLDSPRPSLLATCPAIAAPKLDGDVGYDLMLMGNVTVAPGTFVKLPIGNGSPLCLAIPDGMWGTVLPRSSLAAKGLLAHPTVIDPGYRGPLFIFANYVGESDLVLQAGDRLAQLVLFPSTTPPVIFVDDLPDSERGANGFGSTGS